MRQGSPHDLHVNNNIHISYGGHALEIRFGFTHELVAIIKGGGSLIYANYGLVLSSSLSYGGL